MCASLTSKHHCLPQEVFRTHRRTISTHLVHNKKGSFVYIIIHSSECSVQPGWTKHSYIPNMVFHSCTTFYTRRVVLIQSV